MPLYPVHCDLHGDFEIRCSYQGLKEATCPYCGSPVYRVWNKTPAVIFRPDGWNIPPSDPAYSFGLKDKEKPEAWKVRS